MKLFFDIEMSLGLYWAYWTGKTYINWKQEYKEAFIICIAYKFEDGTTGILKGSEKKIIKDFIKLSEKADELVGHNSQGYDTKVIKGRALKYDLLVPPYEQYDTYLKSKYQFRLPSYSLDYLAKYLGIERKGKMSFEDWIEATKGNKEVLNEMYKYCQLDVDILEQVHNKLDKYLVPSQHHGVLKGSPKWSCPKCGSLDQKLHRQRVTRMGTIKYQLLCKECGSFHTVSRSEYLRFIDAK